MDRLLSNAGIDVWDLLARCVPPVVADRLEIVPVPNGTDFDFVDDPTLALAMITSHARATPLP